MKRKWWVAAVSLAVVAVVLFAWLALEPERRAAVTSAIGLTAPTSAPRLAKPICTSPVNPNVAAPTDCIPEYLAKLPPDPGKAALTQFIDTNKDGLRDDVEIWVEHTFGSSRRAVAAARQVAFAAQETVTAGAAGISPADAKVLATEKTMKAVDCFMHTVEPPLSYRLNEIALAVANTHERFMNRRKFELAASGHVYELKMDIPAREVCGYDPDALTN